MQAQSSLGLARIFSRLCDYPLIDYYDLNNTIGYGQYSYKIDNRFLFNTLEVDILSQPDTCGDKLKFLLN